MAAKRLSVALCDLGPGIPRDERTEAGPVLPASRTDVFSAEKRSAVMRAVPAKGSSAELKARRLLTGMGLRYRLHRADLPGSPDIVLPGRRVAIFVHGCFWHGHDCARGARVPKANRDYWTAKVARNRARDARVQAELGALGWRAEVVWECELKAPEPLVARGLAPWLTPLNLLPP